MARMKKRQARALRRGRAPRKLVCLETYWSDPEVSVLTDFAPAHQLGSTLRTRD